MTHSKYAARYISKLSNKLRRKIDAFSSRENLSGSQGRVLHFLLAQTGDVIQKDIEEEYSLRPPTATELLKKMERDGLIHREAMPNDARMKRIIVSKKTLQYRDVVVADIKVAKLFTDIIMLEDHLQKSQSFWNLWNELFPVVEKLCTQKKDSLLRTQVRNVDQYYGGELDEIVTTYLLAFPWWQEGAHSWHTLQKENASFFTRSSAILGWNPSTIYFIARVLNTIGYDLLNYGVRWLAEIIRNNPHLRESSLQVSTEYYIEEYMQRFIITNRLNIKQTPELRQFIIDILNFLVSRGSTCGFMLRESLC